MYGVNGDTFAKLYKYRLSGFSEWEGMKLTLGNNVPYVVFSENCGSYLSIDETCLSRDEVFTFVTNKAAHGGKGALVAMIASVASGRYLGSALHRHPFRHTDEGQGSDLRFIFRNDGVRTSFFSPFHSCK